MMLSFFHISSYRLSHTKCRYTLAVRTALAYGHVRTAQSCSAFHTDVQRPNSAIKI